MAKDPAFLFYPGDYLRDTQTLSEKAQVAYDRIMCEHMRNICISKQQLKFFTKRLSDEEIEELMFVLTEKEDGFYIDWVAESISKRKAYSDSRSANRKGKTKKDMINMSSSYDVHMENENANEDINNTLLVNDSLLKEEVYNTDDNNNILSWKKDFKIYLEQLEEEYKKLIDDKEFILTQEKYNPGLDILLTLEKSVVNFWGTEAGWQNKKKSRTKNIDWKSTLTKAISIRENKVYKQTITKHENTKSAAIRATATELFEDYQRRVANGTPRDYPKSKDIIPIGRGLFSGI